MMYISSIINKYGDNNNVHRDVMSLDGILNRQGALLVTDCLAEFIGRSKLSYNLSHEEVKNLLESIVTDLREATYERI